MKKLLILIASLGLGTLWFPCRAGEPVTPVPLEDKVKQAQFIVIGKPSKIVSKKYKRGENNSGEFSMELEVLESLFPAQFVAPRPWRLKIIQSRRRISDTQAAIKEGEPTIFLLDRFPDEKDVYAAPIDRTYIAYPVENRARIVELLQQRATAPAK